MAESRLYELVLIFDSGLEDGTIDEKVKKLEERVTANGGNIEDVTRWGKKKLAYPIKKKESGNYVIITFGAGSEQLEGPSPLSHCSQVNSFMTNNNCLEVYT
jgi:small subunit ribosomal protein S6